MLTITDTITDTQVTCDEHDVVESISGWYDASWAEVLDAVRELQDTFLRGEYTGDLEAYLSVTVA